MAEASAGEVLVSSVMTELVSGSGFAFTDRGVHRLKGIEGYWHLFAVSAVEGEPRAPASEPDVAARIRQEIEPTPLAKRRWMRMAVPSLAVLLVAVTALVLTNRPHPVELRADSLAQIDPATTEVLSDVAVAPGAGPIIFVPPDEMWVLSYTDQVVSVVVGYRSER